MCIYIFISQLGSWEWGPQEKWKFLTRLLIHIIGGCDWVCGSVSLFLTPFLFFNFLFYFIVDSESQNHHIPIGYNNKFINFQPKKKKQ